MKQCFGATIAGTLYHRLVLQGEATSGYRVSGLWYQFDPYPPQTLRRKFETDIPVARFNTWPCEADTRRSSDVVFQPKKLTTHERDGNGSDEAMFRKIRAVPSVVCDSGHESMSDKLVATLTKRQTKVYRTSMTP